MPRATAKLRLLALALALPLALAACAASPDPNRLDWDPYERTNRPAHALNAGIDRAAWGPAARAWGRTAPPDLRRGVSNFRANWREPHHALHYTLQGRPGLAARSVLRFGLNTIAGVGGVFDLAGAGGVPYRYTDTDETLHRWGLPEGGYLVLPVGGPGTERDWTGWALDFATDPMAWLLPTAGLNALVATGALDLASRRYDLDAALQTILHESEDSYVALRISYLQAQRARLQDGIDPALLEDVYADF